MNKERNKIIFVTSIVLIGLALVLFIKQKESLKNTELDTPIGQENAVQNTQVPQQKVDSPTKELNNESLFDKKMKEASILFTKKDYQGSVNSYNQALVLQKNEYAYTGLYSAYLALKDYINAEKSILSAIEQDPKSSDYWSWYLVLLSDAMKAPRSKLDTVYNDALNKVSDSKKINVITQYARILENLGDYSGAIGEWQRAITINPDRAGVYNLEIDNLNTKL